MNITFEQLEKIHGEKAKQVWDKICSLGGYGNVNTDCAGGLAVSDDTQNKKEIEKLVEVKGDK